MKNKDVCKPNEQGSTVCSASATPLQNNEENDDNNNRNNCFDTRLSNDQRIYITSLRTRKKAYHIAAFMSDNEISQLGGNPDEIKVWESGTSPNGKLSLSNRRTRVAFYAARWRYFHDRRKVPEALVAEFAKRLIQTVADPESTFGEAEMGSQKTPGTVIFIREEQKVIFSNEEGKIRSAVILSGNEERGQWANFLASKEKNGVFVLFPGNKYNNNKE